MQRLAPTRSGQPPKCATKSFDPEEVADPWFLPPDDAEADADTLLIGEPTPAPASLVDTEGWRAAEAAVAGDLAELSFDLGRLAERMRIMGPGAAQRLSLEEAASLSWWTGDRIGADRLALWTSYRIGAVEEDGGGLIRTAWAARRLAAPAVAGYPAHRDGVTVALQVCCWRCLASACPRRTSSDQIPSVARPFARRTTRVGKIVRHIGYATGGRPAERHLHRLGLGVCDDTVLRQLKNRAQDTAEPPMVIEVL